MRGAIVFLAMLLATSVRADSPDISTRRRIDAVVVYKVDRLTRSLSDFAKIVEV